MARTIVMIGSFDTKGAEYAFLREQIAARGHHVLAVNTGVMGSTDLFRVEVDAEEVARGGGGDLREGQIEGAVHRLQQSRFLPSGMGAHRPGERAHLDVREPPPRQGDRRAHR